MRSAGRSGHSRRDGPQGSGKSTLAAFLVESAATRHGLNALTLSLDDFYLSKAARAEAARTQHPLFATRGVPGTHDVAQAIAVLRALRQADCGAHIALPRFDKTADDAEPPSRWGRWNGPADLVVFEGWCVGVTPQPEAELAAPLNALEREEDAAGQWRRAVNAHIAGDYSKLHAELDALLLFKIGDFDWVRAWRAESEQRRVAAETQAGRDSQPMSPQDLHRFVSHYERLTRWMQRDLPAKADHVVELDRDRRIITPV